MLVALQAPVATWIDPGATVTCPDALPSKFNKPTTLT